jgi:hypothetical protein
MNETAERVVVWNDEDGNYYGHGHIEPEAFRDACLRLDRECGLDEEEIAEFYAGQIEPEAVQHSWFRLKYPGTDNDEAYERCGPDDPGAEPWTEWWQ